MCPLSLCPLLWLPCGGQTAVSACPASSACPAVAAVPSERHVQLRDVQRGESEDCGGPAGSSSSVPLAGLLTSLSRFLVAKATLELAGDGQHVYKSYKPSFSHI